MIDETQIQLTNLKTKLDVSFILLSSQRNVYDEFMKYLNSTKSLPSTVLKTSVTNKTNIQSKIPYDQQSKMF